MNGSIFSSLQALASLFPSLVPAMPAGTKAGMPVLEPGQRSFTGVMADRILAAGAGDPETGPQFTAVDADRLAGVSAELEETSPRDVRGLERLRALMLSILSRGSDPRISLSSGPVRTDASASAEVHARGDPPPDLAPPGVAPAAREDSLDRIAGGEKPVSDRTGESGEGISRVRVSLPVPELAEAIPANVNVATPAPTHVAVPAAEPVPAETEASVPTIAPPATENSAAASATRVVLPVAAAPRSNISPAAVLPEAGNVPRPVAANTSGEAPSAGRVVRVALSSSPAPDPSLPAVQEKTGGGAGIQRASAPQIPARAVPAVAQPVLPEISPSVPVASAGAEPVSTAPVHPEVAGAVHLARAVTSAPSAEPAQLSSPAPATTADGVRTAPAAVSQNVSNVAQPAGAGDVPVGQAPAPAIIPSTTNGPVPAPAASVVAQPQIAAVTPTSSAAPEFGAGVVATVPVEISGDPEQPGVSFAASPEPAESSPTAPRSAQPSPGSAESLGIRPMPATAPPGGAGRGEMLGEPARPAPMSPQPSEAGAPGEPAPMSPQAARSIRTAAITASQSVPAAKTSVPVETPSGVPEAGKLAAPEQAFVPQRRIPVSVPQRAPAPMAEAATPAPASASRAPRIAQLASLLARVPAEDVPEVARALVRHVQVAVARNGSTLPKAVVDGTQIISAPATPTVSSPVAKPGTVLSAGISDKAPGTADRQGAPVNPINDAPAPASSSVNVARVSVPVQPATATSDLRPSGVQRSWTPQPTSLAQSQTTAQSREAGRGAMPGEPAPALANSGSSGVRQGWTPQLPALAKSHTVSQPQLSPVSASGLQGPADSSSSEVVRVGARPARFTLDSPVEPGSQTAPRSVPEASGNTAPEQGRPAPIGNQSDANVARAPSPAASPAPVRAEQARADAPAVEVNPPARVEVAAPAGKPAPNPEPPATTLGSAQPSPRSPGSAESSAIRPMPATAPPGGAGRGEMPGEPAPSPAPVRAEQARADAPAAEVNPPARDEVAAPAGKPAPALEALRASEQGRPAPVANQPDADVARETAVSRSSPSSLGSLGSAEYLGIRPATAANATSEAGRGGMPGQPSPAPVEVARPAAVANQAVRNPETASVVSPAVTQVDSGLAAQDRRAAPGQQANQDPASPATEGRGGEAARGASPATAQAVVQPDPVGGARVPALPSTRSSVRDEGIKAAVAGAAGRAETAGVNAARVAESMPPAVQAALTQIADEALRVNPGEVRELTLDLKTAGLGRVTVRLALGENNAVRIELVTGTEQAARTLRVELPQLTLSLERNSLPVESASVNVGSGFGTPGHSRSHPQYFEHSGPAREVAGEPEAVGASRRPEFTRFSTVDLLA